MTTPAALSLPLLPPREFRARTLSLAPGQSIEREALLEAARAGRLRARRRRHGGRAVEPAGRHRRRLLAHPRAAGAGGVLRRRGRVAARLRSDQPALRRARQGARRAAAGRGARGDRGPDRLPAGGRARGARGPRPARRAARRRAVGRAARRPPRGLPAIGASAHGGTDGGRDAGHHGHALRGRLPRSVQGAWPPRSADGAGRASPCGSWWTTSGRPSASGACCPSTSSRPGRE